MRPCHRAVLTTRDAAILRSLIGRHGPAIDGLIAAKLANAATVLPECIGRDIVTLHSRVAYASQDAPPDMRIVVHSEALAVPGMTLPVYAPRGLALLGARVGETVTVPGGAGERKALTVLAVPYQPEAGGFALAAPGDAGTAPVLRPPSATILRLHRGARP
jgi:regulator of nucleoside diphosphate kinase